MQHPFIVQLFGICGIFKYCSSVNVHEKRIYYLFASEGLDSTKRYLLTLRFIAVFINDTMISIPRSSADSLVQYEAKCVIRTSK